MRYELKGASAASEFQERDGHENISEMDDRK
jgi:hypothetical protein